MVNESNLAFGTGKCGIKDLDKYYKVFLGHQHQPQTLKEGRIWHLGSVRYCSFAEVKDQNKQIAILDGDKVEFIPLKAPIPMYKAKKVENLAQIPKKTKVCLEVASFKELKENIGIINQAKEKFVEFKYELKFVNRNIKGTNEPVKAKKLNEILQQGIKEIKDKEVRELLEQELEGLK